MPKKLSRKKFIQSHGATCRNWASMSWSFVNEAEKIIIFGAWRDLQEGNSSMILSEDWKRKSNGHKSPAFGASREHIRLVKDEGYSLKIFQQVSSETEGGAARVKNFTAELEDRTLVKIGNDWYAANTDQWETTTWTLNPGEAISLHYPDDLVIQRRRPPILL